MTTEVYDAVYQNGAFRPVHPIASSFSEGQHVRLVIEVEEADVLDLAGNVYDGLNEDEVTEVEQIALDRRDFFGRAAS